MLAMSKRWRTLPLQGLSTMADDGINRIPLQVISHNATVLCQVKCYDGILRSDLVFSCVALAKGIKNTATRSTSKYVADRIRRPA